MTNTAEIARNQTYALRLGWKPGELVMGATQINDAFIAGVKKLQTQLGVTADGIFGPASYKAAITARQAVLVTGPQSGDRVALAGQVAVLELKKVWLENIIDPPNATDPAFDASRKAIDAMIRTPLGSNWTWEEPYRKDGHSEWCGHALSRAYSGPSLAVLAADAAARVTLKQPIRTTYLPSTYRLDRFARYQPINDKTPNPRPPTGPYRMMTELDGKSRPEQVLFVDGSSPRAGDVLLIGNKNYGQHITLIESWDPATGAFKTIEGNAFGLGPNGQKQQGVVRAVRHVASAAPPGESYVARRIIRFAPSDFV